VLLSAGISVVFSHVPLANRKKSSPGETVRSSPARSMPDEGAGADAVDVSEDAGAEADDATAAGDVVAGAGAAHAASETTRTGTRPGDERGMGRPGP
jgi:hypothetical protein